MVGRSGGDRVGLAARCPISASACSQLSLKPIPKPALTRRTSVPMSRLSRMLPTRSYVTSGQSTQLSWTSTHFRPATPAAAATWRVWFDWTPPIETSVSQPWASASATRYSSLRALLPPKARPEVRIVRSLDAHRGTVISSTAWTRRTEGHGPRDHQRPMARASRAEAELHDPIAEAAADLRDAAPSRRRRRAGAPSAGRSLPFEPGRGGRPASIPAARRGVP